MTAVRFKQYKVKKSGLRGAVVSMPPAQMEAMGVVPGDMLSFYTGVMNGKPVVIIANMDSSVITDAYDSVQGKDLAKYMEARR